MTIDRTILLRFCAVSLVIDVCYILQNLIYPNETAIAGVFSSLLLLGITHTLVSKQIGGYLSGFMLIYFDIMLRYFLLHHAISLVFFEIFLILLVGLLVFTRRERFIVGGITGMLYGMLVFFEVSQLYGNTYSSKTMSMIEMIVYGLFGLYVIIMHRNQIEKRQEQSTMLVSRLQGELDKIVGTLDAYIMKCDQLQAEVDNFKLEYSLSGKSSLEGAFHSGNAQENKKREREEKVKYDFYLFSIHQMRSQLGSIRTFVEMQKRAGVVNVSEIENSVKILSDALHELTVKVSFDCVDAGIELTANEYHFLKNSSQ